MAILLVMSRHYSWRNNTGTKLNVQAGRNVTAYQNKKVFRLFLTGNFFGYEFYVLSRMK